LSEYLDCEASGTSGPKQLLLLYIVDILMKLSWSVMRRKTRNNIILKIIYYSQLHKMSLSLFKRYMFIDLLFLEIISDFL